jgi:hypothetical protein
MLRVGFEPAGEDSSCFLDRAATVIVICYFFYGEGLLSPNSGGQTGTPYRYPRLLLNMVAADVHIWRLQRPSTTRRRAMLW